MDESEISSKSKVIQILKGHYPEMKRRFGIERLGIFGSVSRAEDKDNSDVDILYSFSSGRGNLKDYSGAVSYLENILNRDIDFVSLEFLNPNLKPYIEKDIVMLDLEVCE